MKLPASPLVLFGAQSGRPSEADVVRTLETARAAGYSDFMVYARSGLEMEYMGKEWLALVGHYLHHAERLGMGIWLYDEFNWPSGSCNRRVTEENPDFRNATIAVVPNGDGFFEWRLSKASPESANVFDAEAMSRFRAMTHEVYERRFWRYFGSVIRGMFFDEPGSGWWPQEQPGEIARFRWYRGLEADYLAETGRDFRADVEGFCRDRSDTRVWEDYTAVMGHAFRRAFVDPASAWAERLGIVSTGHFMAESNPFDAAANNGLVLHVMKGMSKPGVDDIFTRTDAAGAEWLTLASVQHAADRSGRCGIAELFALGPADLPFDKMRQQLWLFAFHKVDSFLLGLHFQSPHGFVEKPHYAMFHSPLQPWFFDQEAFHSAAREAAEFARKPFAYDAAVRCRERAAGRVMFAGGERRTDLVNLLRALESRQMAANLLEENEPAKEAAIFDFDGAGILEERTGHRFPTADEAADWLVSSGFSVVPALEGGIPATDLSVRRYGDGTAALINLREEDRALVFVAGDGARIPVFLPARGVWTYRPVASSWLLSLDRPNRLRIPLPSGVARIVAEKPLSVRFALCALPAAESTVTLDGAPLVAVRPCTFLGFGYDNGYGETDPVALAPGEHVFTCSGHGDAGRFLPALWMEGSFAVDREPAMLVPVPKFAPCGPLARIGLGDFAGKATYSAETDVPADAEAFEVGTGHAVASVRLGGRDLGRRLFSPLRFIVPPEFCGSCQRLEITVTTSILPMFGAGRFERPSWVRTIPEETGTGLLYSRWVSGTSD